jgi:hypothetical protein
LFWWLWDGNDQAVAAGATALWFVDSHNHNQRTSLGNVPPALHELLPKEDMLGHNHPRGGLYHTCAVVGSSGLLLKYQVGAETRDHSLSLAVVACQTPPFPAAACQLVSRY